MKKKVLCVLPLLLSMAFVVSCNTTPNTSVALSNSTATSSVTTNSSATTASTSSTSSAYTQVITEPTTVNFWSITGQNNKSQIDKYIADFEKLEPNVTVKSVIQTGMNYTQLGDACVKGFSVGDYPDMVQAYPDTVATFLDYGKAVNLDPYINNTTYGWSAADKADYIDAFVNEGKQYTVSGTYSVPYCKSTELMFYDAGVLKGLDLSSYDATINGGNVLSQSYFDNLTWEELFNHLCPAIVAYNATLPANAKILKTDQAYHSVFGYDSDDNLFITLADQYGYGYTSVNTSTGNGSVDFNNAGMKGLMNTFNTAAKNGYIMSKGSAGNNYTNTYFTKQNTLFEVGSTGGVKYMFDSTNPMDVGVARIPHAAGKNAQTILQGPSIAMLDHGDANRKTASWLFYKFMTNAENSLDWAINSGYMGIRNSNYTNQDYIDANDADSKDSKTLEKLMALSNTYTQKILGELFTSPAFKGSSVCRTQAAAIMTQALTTTSDITKIDDWFTAAENTAKLAM